MPKFASSACQGETRLMGNQLTFGDLLLMRTGHFTFTEADKQRWLIDDIWQHAGTGILSGVPKIGKTWLTLDAAVSVASGKPFLGKYAVRQGPVIIRSPEGSTYLLEERIAEVCKRKKVVQADLELYIVDRGRLYFNKPDDQELIRQAIAKVRPALFIGDPLKNCFSGDENYTPEISQMTNFLTELSNEFGVAVWLVHHDRKSNGGDDDGKGIRGSSALFGFGDSYLFLKKGKRGHINLRRIHSDAAPLDPLPLKLKNGGFVIDAADRTENKVDFDDRIFALMKTERKKRWTVDMLRKRVQGSNSQYSPALSRLVNLGYIHKHPNGGYSVDKPKEKPKKKVRPSVAVPKAQSRTDEAKTG